MRTMHLPIFAFQALLAALLVAQLSGQNVVEPTTDCPRPVNCVRDPCEGARCPRFVNTECRADFCNGECKATFFRLSDGRELTDRCSVETCDEKVCSGSRTCIEEVVPPACPAGSPNCRQYIKARCVLPPPVTNCSFVACLPETVCVVKNTSRGPRPRCVAPPPPSSCEELECEEGMECFERKREGLHSVVRCVPAEISETPRNCSELECPDGFVCMVSNNRAICAMVPTPRNCSELECEPGQECREVTVTSNTTTPLCITVTVIGSTCEELECGTFLGQECTTLTIDDLSIPAIFSTSVCTPTANCSLLEAHCHQRGQVCEVRGEGDSAVARCVRPTTCEKVLCNPGYECVAFMFNDSKCPATVRPGMFFLQPFFTDLNVAVCLPSVIRSSCKELNCRDQGCAFTGYPARNVSLAYCFDQPTVVPSPQPTITPFPQPSCNRTNPCLGGMEICVDLKQDDIQLDTSCVTINCLENNTICDPGFTCRSIPSELEGTADFDSVCTEDASNFEFGGGCEERECDGGQMCYEVEFEGELVGTICIPRQQPTPSPQPTPFPQPSCNDTNPCLGGMEICVDLKQDDIQLDTSCVTINCLENNTICDPGFTCRSIPSELEGTADFDSVCTEDASNFEFGGGCKERECDEGQMCYEVEFEGELVGTICIPRQQPTPSPQPTPFPQPSCNDTNPCLGGMEICVDLKQDDIQLDTSCVTINCLENNTICDPAFTCRSIPSELEGTADFDSVCTEDASNFEFGGGCEERECDEGQMCYEVEFERKLVGTICIPRQQPTPSPQPTPFTQPSCNDTNPCLGGMEICVDLKQDDIQLDTSCVMINCLENNTICDPGFTCRSIPSELEGTADFDSVCTEDASNFEFGGGCEERECDEGQVCYEVEFERKLVGTICIPRQQPTSSPQPTPFPQPSCNDTNPCLGGMEICVDLKQDNIQLDTSCVTINCLENNTICDPGFTCRSIPSELEGTADFDSVCTEDASNFEFGGGCEERECDEGQMCYEVEFERKLVGTICIPRQQPTSSPQPTPFPQPSCNDTNPCLGGMEICVDLKQDDIQLDTSCVTINCLENNTICDPGFTCRSIPSELEGTADFDSVCTEDASNFEFGGGCKERECDEGQMCYEVEFERKLVGTICIPRQQPTSSPQPTPFPQPSCNDTNPCLGGMEICVDLKQDDIQLDTSCVTINCLENTTICDPGFTCRSIPSELEGTADFDSVCIEDASNFEFGGGCEERECDEGQMCQNVEFERTLVGTVCIPRQRPPELGCRGLNCREGEECVIIRIGNSPPIAGCLCSAIITQGLESIDILPSTLCDDVECDEGMECQVIVKEAGFPLVTPICVPSDLNVLNAGKRV